MPTFTTDVTTPIGQTRLLLSDLDPDNPIFPDDAFIQAFLNIEDQSVVLAAARGYEVIAGNVALSMKVCTILDVKYDGKQSSAAFLAVAKQWRDNNQDDWAGIDFAQVTDDSVFSYREFLYKQLIQQYATSY